MGMEHEGMDFSLFHLPAPYLGWKEDTYSLSSREREAYYGRQGALAFTS